MMRQTVAFLAISGAISGVFGQSNTVDLTMSNNRQGQLELRVRTTSDFDGCPSALTFTVRWPASAGMALDTAVRCYPFQDVMPVNAVAVVENGAYMYRTFNGFSVSTLADFGLVWEAGREYPICTADVLVPGTTFELVDDAWTDANNRSYYCSLGGEPSTGIYFPSPEPTVNVRSSDQGTGVLDVILTPQDDFFGWVTDLTFTVRWSSASGIHLGDPVQDPEVAEYLTIAKIGGETVDGVHTYQRFQGTGLKSIANADDAWWSGIGTTVISVPLIGTDPDLMIVNDDWTAGHEGDYAIRLNGLPLAGELEDMATAVPNMEDPGPEVVAFRTHEGIRVNTTGSEPGVPMTIGLFNAAGQSMWVRTFDHPQRSGSTLIGLPGISEGLYILTVRQGSRQVTRRVVM